MSPQPPRKPVPKIRKKPDLVRECSDRQMKKPAPGPVGLAKEEQHLSNPDMSEISLDDLRNRLSQFLGVSFDKLEGFFEG